MNSVYDEILNDIKQALEDGDLEKAHALIDNELNMPYIPPEVEEKLKALNKDLHYQESEKSTKTEIPLDDLLRLLKGNEKSQLVASVQLANRNLRNCLDEIKDWLSKNPCVEAASYIIEALSEQKIETEIDYNKNGNLIHFSTKDIKPVIEIPGFIEGAKFLRKYLEVNHPDILQMTWAIFVHSAYINYPDQFTPQEGLDAAMTAIEEVSNYVDDGETYKEVYETYKKLS